MSMPALIKIELGGRAFELAPYRLGKMRRAAIFIDHINETVGALDTLEGMLKSARDILEVLAIGIVEIDPTLDADALEEMLGMDDLPALQSQFKYFLEECGLARKGEAAAPSAPPAQEGATASADSLAE